MPFGSVKLLPGVNVERTPTLLEASISQSQLIRFKDSLAQKYGGWDKYYPFTVTGNPRDLHAWQDLNGDQHLLVGTTEQLGVITSMNLTDITPQQVISNAVCSFSTTADSTAVVITDPNISNVTVFDSVNMMTPVAVGSLVLFGIYPIETINGTSSFTIYSDVPAASGTSGGAVPLFTTISSSATITVMLATHGLSSTDRVVFEVDTPASGGNDTYTKILLHMDGVDGTTTFVDSNAGGSAHSWTANGSAVITRSDFEFGGASGLVPLGGTGSITTPDHADFTLATSKFTVDFWFKTATTVLSDAAVIFGQNDSIGDDSSVRGYLDVNGMLTFQAFSDGTTQVAGIFGPSQATSATWHHGAIVRGDGVLYAFTDGVAATTAFSNASAIYDSSSLFGVFGLGAWTSSLWFLGWIDEFNFRIGTAVWTSNFTPPTSPYGNGLDIDGHYSVVTVPTVNTFTIIGNAKATNSGDYAMNNGFARLVYNITLGPPAAGAGYGTGGYGEGGYGTGEVGDSQVGTAITAIDWTSDNWGEIALACPQGGGVYQYNPTDGFQNAALVDTAPIYNGGIFVSTTLQILFCWGASIEQALGTEQDPMLISWSDLGDYTVFTPKTTNQAGSFRIPIGSVIRAGAAVQSQNLFWTDLDVWSANYAGYPLVFGFNKIGAGAGAISSHAVQQLRNGIFWMGETNFYSYTGSGVQVVPCPVWDFVFQNLDQDFKHLVRAMPNTGFNEVGWLFPSTSSASGECDSYVKFNITEQGQPWDYGMLQRSAWIDLSILGQPIAANLSGVVYQQETTNDADGQPLSASFTTGYFMIGDGEEFAFVDQVIPDMKWANYGASGSAQVYLTFNVINYPGDTPASYGPYLMTSTTEYISTRFRGRQMSVTVASSDTGSFWRLGRIRYRWAPSGRR